MSLLTASLTFIVYLRGATISWSWYLHTMYSLHFSNHGKATTSFNYFKNSLSSDPAHFVCAILYA